MITLERRIERLEYHGPDESAAKREALLRKINAATGSALADLISQDILAILDALPRGIRPAPGSWDEIVQASFLI